MLTQYEIPAKLKTIEKEPLSIVFDDCVVVVVVFFFEMKILFSLLLFSDSFNLHCNCFVDIHLQIQAAHLISFHCRHHHHCRQCIHIRVVCYFVFPLSLSLSLSLSVSFNSILGIKILYNKTEQLVANQATWVRWYAKYFPICWGMLFEWNGMEEPFGYVTFDGCCCCCYFLLFVAHWSVYGFIVLT